MPTVKELRLDARIYDLVGHNLADDEYIFSHIHLAFHAPDAKNERASKSRETSTIVFPHGHTISEVKKNQTDRQKATGTWIRHRRAPLPQETMTNPSDVLCASARLSAKQAGTNQPGEQQSNKNNNHERQPRITPTTVDDANEDTQLHATFAKILL